MDITIRISNGEAAAIYRDDIAPELQAIGDVTIERASHVEYDNARGGWVADMRPSGADVQLGPYPTRAEALAVEVEWLRIHRGL